MSDCIFPTCGHPATGTNRAGQAMCGGHERVVIPTTDDLGHGKSSEGVSDQ